MQGHVRDLRKIADLQEKIKITDAKVILVKTTPVTVRFWSFPGQDASILCPQKDSVSKVWVKIHRGSLKKIINLVGCGQNLLKV